MLHRLALLRFNWAAANAHSQGAETPLKSLRNGNLAFEYLRVCKKESDREVVRRSVWERIFNKLVKQVKKASWIETNQCTVC